MNPRIVLIALLTLVLISCTSITTIDKGACGTGDASGICLGKQDVPEKQVNLFNKASQEVVDTLNSPQFIEDLSEFINKYSKHGAHSESWNGLDVTNVQNKLINEVNGLTIETYGGIKGGFLALFFGNKAFDGTKNGPIKLNRWALPAPSASIANTIAHEAAHRIGYSHPNSSQFGKLNIAFCEPPYVIGSIVEQILLGKEFNASGHCHLLKST
jgi:hypothetical protein